MKKESVDQSGIRREFTFCVLTWILLLVVSGRCRATENRENPHQFINSTEELTQHFKAHVLRVKTLGMTLYAAYPRLFPGVSEDLLERFLNLHDQAKLNTGTQFKTRFWAGSLTQPSFIERLFPIYAANWRVWSEAQQFPIKATIEELNATDSNVARYFFKLNHLLEKDGSPSSTARRLLKIERIADVVDRNLDPVAQEEFSNEKRLPLSLFLKTPLDLELADFLVEQYDRLTASTSYATFHSKPCQVIFRLSQ